MLGTLRMDIQTCINEYLKMAPNIFPVEGSISGSTVGKFLKVARGRQRFDPEPLEVAVKRLVKEHAGDSAGENKPFKLGTSNASERHECKVLVISLSRLLCLCSRFHHTASCVSPLKNLRSIFASEATKVLGTSSTTAQFGKPAVPLPLRLPSSLLWRSVDLPQHTLMEV